MGAPFGSNSKMDPTSKRKPDIIAGKDFLSLFMASAPASPPKDLKNLENTSTIKTVSKSTTIDSFTDNITTTVTAIYDEDISNTSISTHNEHNMTTTTQAVHQHKKHDLLTEESEQQQTIIRDSRSSNIYSFGYKSKHPEEYDNDNNHPYYPPLPESDEIAINTSAPAQVLSISVSSSVGQSPSPTTKLKIETSTRSQYDNYQQRPLSEDPVLTDQDNVGLRNVAAASKSLLNVDEMEPMTIDNNNPIKELHNTFKETQRQIGANPDYLEQQRYKQIQKLHPVQHPYHHSVVFHGQSKDGTRARSVSYSSVIQNIQPAVAERNWEQQAESIERPSYLQNTHSVLNKGYESLNVVSTSSPSPNYSQWGRLEKEVKDLEKVDSTSVLPIAYQQPEVQWGQPERNEERETTKFENVPTSSPNYQQQEIQWGQPEVNYEESYKQPTPTPKYVPPPVYATEEQNYEVDESVSVMTNGRAHGIQERPPQPVIPLQQEQQQQTSNSQSQQQGDNQQSGVPSGDKTDNNHKVGYVVEGRNFRKYRVEERTSDGFVVGEYGVVNHDDGSLRGVRYTADGTINPRLIYDALMKFLSL